MSTHTPGPWIITEEDDYGGCEIVADEWAIAQVHGGISSISNVAANDECSVSRANAALIASAPTLAANLAASQATVRELVAALRDALPHLCASPTAPLRSVYEAANTARAALARAESGQ